MTSQALSGWTAEDPVDIGFAWAASTDGEFADRDGDGFLARDLGLAAVSGGALGVDHLRLADAEAAAAWRAQGADFSLFYVLAGTATMVTDGGSEVLAAGGCAVQSRPVRHRFTDVSPDFEAVRISAPARFATSEIAESAAGDAGPVYTHDTPDQYERGNGPRSFFLYRDLQTRELTDGRIHVHVVRATEPGPGTGWHYHTMAQWFMILGGTSVIRVEDRPRYPLGRLDAMCVGRGPQMRHNVTDFSGDYAVLEMCVPGEYDTIAVDEPDGADAA